MGTDYTPAVTLNTLVVEDEDVFYTFLRKHLETFDISISITRAYDGKEALEKLQEALDQNNPFDLMLTDIIMPGMDGMELLRTIKENPAIKEDLFMYVITGKASPQDHEELQTFSFVKDVLSKPVNTERLKMIVFPAFIHKARKD